MGRTNVEVLSTSALVMESTSMPAGKFALIVGVSVMIALVVVMLLARLWH